MPLLEVRGLSKRYGRRLAVEDVTFSVGEGEVLGLLGPNGAGKTTTLKSILGLVRPSRGSILYRGVDITGGLPPRLAREIGYVPELPEAPPWLTACELLEYLALSEGYSRFEAGIAARRALEVIGGETLCDRKLARISKGERKRVLIAQALLSPRSLYIMDEPFTGLDAEWVAMVRRIIVDSSRDGAAVIVSSHILKEIEDVASKVAIIRGRLLYLGSLDELEKIAVRKVVVETPNASRAARVLMDSGLKVLEVMSRKVTVEADNVDTVYSALKEAGIEIEGIRIEKASLEDAYLKIIRAGGAR